VVIFVNYLAIAGHLVVDPLFIEKERNVVSLSLCLSDDVVVFSVGGKPQI
jgi:hypothetical protein